MTDPMLQIKELTVHYGSHTALDGVSLTVGASEIHAVLGENGAGKTTLLRVLTGLLKKGTSAGQMAMAGHPVTIATPLDAIKQGLGVVARRAGIFAGMTVADNIVVGAWQQERSFIINPQKVREQAQHALDLVGLKLDPDARAGALSPIQQRLLMIARACVTTPRIIVLDEPAAFLTTPQELSQLFTVVRGLAARGIGTLYLSRRPAEVVQIADRISVLRDGRVVMEQTRTAFDEASLIQNMISQRIGDGAYVDYDDLNESKTGWLDGLRNLFTGNRR